MLGENEVGENEVGETGEVQNIYYKAAFIAFPGWSKYKCVDNKEPGKLLPSQ